MTLVPSWGLAIIFLIGLVLGVWLGQWLVVKMGLSNLMEEVTERVSKQVMDEHRAYRAVLADRVGSITRADQLMKAYQRRETL